MRNAKVTGADIIEAMLANLCTHLEPIRYTAQAPSFYCVYLHKSDFTRLKGIFPQIIDEAKQALNDEIRKLNRKSVIESLRERLQKRLPLSVRNRFAARPSLVYQAPKEGWKIAFYLDVNGALSQGDVAILSELVALPEIEYGEGIPTMSIRTVKRATRRPESEPAESITTIQPPVKEFAKSSYSMIDRHMPTSQPRSTQPSIITPRNRIYAVIRYRDNDGDHIFQMTKSPIIIGRGGKDQIVDLKLKTDVRVSREHLRLRRDERTGRFYIEDLSTYGVSMKGENISSRLYEVTTGTALEIALPTRASITLADIVTLEFEALEGAQAQFEIDESSL